jgi:hypothetical protein
MSAVPGVDPEPQASALDDPALRERIIDLIRELAEELHQTASIRDHADPNDRTGWHVHAIETCEYDLCVDSLAALRDLGASAPASLHYRDR